MVLLLTLSRKSSGILSADICQEVKQPNHRLQYYFIGDFSNIAKDSGREKKKQLTTQPKATESLPKPRKCSLMNAC